MEGVCTRNLSLLANNSPHTSHICGMQGATEMVGEWCRRASRCGFKLYPGPLAFIILPWEACTPSSASLPQPFPRLSYFLEWHKKFFTSQPVFQFSFLPFFFFFFLSFFFLSLFFLMGSHTSWHLFQCFYGSGPMRQAKDMLWAAWQAGSGHFWAVGRTACPVCCSNQGQILPHSPAQMSVSLHVVWYSETWLQQQQLLPTLSTVLLLYCRRDGLLYPQCWPEAEKSGEVSQPKGNRINS